MGYILPISLHQYEQYQYRMIEEEDRDYYIDKVQKVAFHTAKGMSNEGEEQASDIVEQAQIYEVRTRPVEAFQIAPADRIVLTGKGGNINVSV